jgi:hypothetical protein
MGQPPYGAPGPYPPPQYGGPYGTPPPPPPPKRNLLPGLIVGGAVLISGLGLLLVVLLTRDDDPAGTQAAASTTTASASATPSRAELPGGARVVEPEAPEGGGNFAGSDDVALAWVQAMADGEFQTAYDLSCADVQASATAADDGSGPDWALGTYFFEQTLGGQGFTEGSFDDIQYSPVADSDVATFTLQLDNGESYQLLVYVDSTLAVCDFI